RFHLMFNVIGVLWMMAVIYPVLNGIDLVVQTFSHNPVSIMGNDPAARPNATLGLSLFHTSFNVLNVVILFAFVPYIVRLIERLLPDNGPQDDQYQLKYISLGVMTSPGLSVEQAQKEIQNFAEIIEKMHGVVDELLFDPQAEEHTSELQSRENLVCRL